MTEEIVTALEDTPETPQVGDQLVYADMVNLAPSVEVASGLDYNGADKALNAHVGVSSNSAEFTVVVDGVEVFRGGFKEAVNQFNGY